MQCHYSAFQVTREHIFPSKVGAKQHWKKLIWPDCYSSTWNTQTIKRYSSRRLIVSQNHSLSFRAGYELRGSLPCIPSFLLYRWVRWEAPFQTSPTVHDWKGGRASLAAASNDVASCPHRKKMTRLALHLPQVISETPCSTMRCTNKKRRISYGWNGKSSSWDLHAKIYQLDAGRVPVFPVPHIAPQCLAE